MLTEKKVTEKTGKRHPRKFWLSVVVCLMATFLVMGTLSPVIALKIVISHDHEGIPGVVSRTQTSTSGKEWGAARKWSTAAINAAIEGALAAGATEILVSDGHGSKETILPDMLHKDALLIRGGPLLPYSMAHGVTYPGVDAVILVGYHARAGAPNGVLAHTITGSVENLWVNEVLMGETGYVAAVAGVVNVPVIMVSGDRTVCKEAQDLLGKELEVAVVKWIEEEDPRLPGAGLMVTCMHPEKANELIKQKAEAAVRKFKQGLYKPYPMPNPTTIRLELTRAGVNIWAYADLASQIPGVRRVAGEDIMVTYSGDPLEVLALTRVLASNLTGYTK